MAGAAYSSDTSRGRWVCLWRPVNWRADTQSLPQINLGSEQDRHRLTSHPALVGWDMITSVTKCSAYAVYLTSKGHLHLLILAMPFPDLSVKVMLRSRSTSALHPAHPRQSRHWRPRTMRRPKTIVAFGGRQADSMETIF